MSTNDTKFIFSKPEEKYPILNNFQGLGPLIHDSCRKFGERTAQIDSVTGISETFSSLNSRSIQFALSLRALGIEAGDMITVCSVSTLDVTVVPIGGWYIGALLSFLDPSLSHPTTLHLLNEVKPKLIVCSSTSLKQIESCVKELSIAPIIVVFGDAKAPNISFSSLFRDAADVKDFAPFKPKSVKDTAFVMFSSGTTGLAKGICLHHYSVIYENACIRDYCPGIECVLHFTSFYWISGIALFLYAITEGANRVLVPKFDPNTALDVLSKYKVNYIITAMLNVLLLKNCDYKKYDLSHMKYVGIGGTTTNAQQMRLARDIFPQSLVSQAYAMTEQAGIITVFHPVRDRVALENKPESCGTIVAGVTCKVVDLDTGLALGPNQRGEFRFKSPSVMNGYYNRDSTEAWDSEGWLKTGDVLYYDDDNYFYVVDRIKDMFKFRSWHVTPSAIEGVLMQHPLVKEAVVVGIPHEVDGDLPMGIVVLNGDQHPDGIEQELIQFVEDRVGFRDRLHGGLKVVQSIPRTPTGKSKRWDLRNMVLEGKL